MLVTTELVTIVG